MNKIPLCILYIVMQWKISLFKRVLQRKKVRSQHFCTTVEDVCVDTRHLSVSGCYVIMLKDMIPISIDSFAFFLKKVHYLFLSTVYGNFAWFHIHEESVPTNFVISTFNVYPESGCFIPFSSLLLYSVFELFCLFSS